MALRVALAIAWKDARIYYLKGPNLTFGLLMPLALYWAFAIDRAVEARAAVPGLIATALLFGSGAVQGVALPLERRTGTVERLMLAPVAPLVIILGKALAGAMFGVLLAVVYLVVCIVILGISVHIGLYTVSVVLLSCVFSIFGLLLAVPFRDIPQAMPPATVVRMALVIVSGGFSGSMAPAPWGMAAQAMPLIHAIDGVRQAMSATPDVRAWLVDATVLIASSAALLLLATRLFQLQTH